MSVYFDSKVQAAVQGTNTGIYYHKVKPVLAVTTYNQFGGGSVCLYDKNVKYISEP